MARSLPFEYDAVKSFTLAYSKTELITIVKSFLWCRFVVFRNISNKLTWLCLLLFEKVKVIVVVFTHRFKQGILKGEVSLYC